MDVDNLSPHEHNSRCPSCGHIVLDNQESCPECGTEKKDFWRFSNRVLRVRRVVVFGCCALVVTYIAAEAIVLLPRIIGDGPFPWTGLLVLGLYAPAIILMGLTIVAACLWHKRLLDLHMTAWLLSTSVAIIVFGVVNLLIMTSASAAV